MTSSQRRYWRGKYETEVELNPYDYEAWRRYVDFERREGRYSRIRQTFERAIQNVPRKKCFWWPDYIYLWLDYAWFEEHEAGDMERARTVYSRCIGLIPHEKFSFDNVWISAARFEINQSNFENARFLFESAIEKAPTKNIFKAYIEMERKLGDVMGSRTLFMRYVQWSPCDDHSSWLEFIEFEKSQSNPDGARFIYDIAISKPVLERSTSLLVSYIDFETSEGEHEKAREIFEKLLEHNKHISTWIEYARFEASKAEQLLHEEQFEDENSKRKKKKSVFAETYIERVRDICRKALHHFTASTRADSEVRIRTKILKEWESLERNFGSLGNVNLVLDLVARFNQRIEGITLS